MDNQIHTISFKESTVFSLTGLQQWDKGQVFKFDETYPDGTEVQFEDGSINVIVSGKITLPDKFLTTPGRFKCWVQVIGTDHETTVHTINYTVNPRVKKSDYINPEDVQTFREDIQTLVNQASAIGQDAKQTAEAAQNAADQAQETAEGAFELAGNLNTKIAYVDGVYAQAVERAQDAALYASNASASADLASDYADAAEQSANKAGYMYFDIDSSGHLIETRSTNDTPVSFQLSNGRLEVLV